MTRRQLRIGTMQTKATARGRTARLLAATLWLTSLTAFAPTACAEWIETAKLFGADTLPGSWAGWGSKGVDIDSGTVVLGAAQPNGVGPGEAYVFRNEGGGWTQVGELAALDGAVGELFGSAVAVSGNRAVVTAPEGRSPAGRTGAAYVFEYSGSAWQQVAKLTADDGASGDTFGSDVAIHGDSIIVGANHDEDQGHFTGAAYVFRNDGSGWSQAAKLTASDQAEFDGFGTAVAIHGNTALVGAVDEGADGSVYVFEDSGAGWQQVGKWTATEKTGINGAFGWSLDLEENRAVVGRFRAPDEAGGAGAAYVFDRTDSGWMETARLLADDAASGDALGISVGLSGDTIIAGAYSNDELGGGAGAAYVFDFDGTGWSQTQKLFGSTVAASDLFGYSVAVENGTIVATSLGDDEAGARAGAAFVFANVPEPSSWALMISGAAALALLARRRRRPMSD